MSWLVRVFCAIAIIHLRYRDLTRLALPDLEKVIEHDYSIARALQITGNPVSRQALHARVNRHREKSAAISKKEEDAAETLLLLGSSSQEDPDKFEGMPKLADPFELIDGGSDDEDDEDGDEDGGTDERERSDATKKERSDTTKKASGSANGQGVLPGISPAPVLTWDPWLMAWLLM